MMVPMLLNAHWRGMQEAKDREGKCTGFKGS